MAETVQRVRQFFGALSRGAKLAIAAVLTLSIAAGIYFWAANYPKQGDFEILFSNLDPKDASEIVELLSERKIPHQISSGGTTISVPADDVHTARLSLASEGLPRGGVVGFELMDSLSFGATDFDRRINYLRALTGELTRTILKIDGVEDARVHIVLPEDSYFVSRTRPATAAVFLKINPRFELERSQIKGVVHLVSASVEGLKPEDVAVIDLYGRLLSQEGSTNQQSSVNLTAQTDFQKELETGLQSLLERVLGPGNVITKVTAELNFDMKTIDSILYQPEGDGVLRSMQQLEETFRGEGVGSSGIPGTTSNIPQYTTGGSTGTSESDRRETVSNWEISEVKETTVVAPGSVKRLSVAVIVNRRLGDAEQELIQSTVEAAIGLDPERRDVVSVASMPFDNTLLDEVKAQMDADKPAPLEGPKLPSQTVLIAAGAGLLLIVVSVTVLLRVRRRRRRQAEDLAPEPDIEMALRAAAEMASQQVPQEPEEPDLEAERRKRLREEVEEVARSKPETVAEMIRAWMAEDRR